MSFKEYLSESKLFEAKTDEFSEKFINFIVNTGKKTVHLIPNNQDYTKGWIVTDTRRNKLFNSNKPLDLKTLKPIIKHLFDKGIRLGVAVDSKGMPTSAMVAMPGMKQGKRRT